MRINTQNMFWMNKPGSQKALNQFLPGAARTADSQRALKQRAIQEKAAALIRGGDTKKIDTGLENTGPAALSSFIVAKEDVPVKAAQKIEAYYQTTGSLADSITYKETRLLYLQSEYEKIAANGSEKHAEKMKELIASEYQDMAGVLDYMAELLGDSLRNCEAVYGKPFSEEYRGLLGDIPDKISSISEELKNAGSIEEGLAYLAKAKEQLASLGDELKDRYQEYTGKELAEYEYRTKEDYGHAVGSYGLLWSWDEVTVDTDNLENLADYGVDISNLSGIPVAMNLIDTKA